MKNNNLEAENVGDEQEEVPVWAQQDDTSVISDHHGRTVRPNKFPTNQKEAINNQNDMNLHGDFSHIENDNHDNHGNHDGSGGGGGGDDHDNNDDDDDDDDDDNGDIDNYDNIGDQKSNFMNDKRITLKKERDFNSKAKQNDRKIDQVIISGNDSGNGIDGANSNIDHSKVEWESENKYAVKKAMLKKIHTICTTDLIYVPCDLKSAPNVFTCIGIGIACLLSLGLSLLIPRTYIKEGQGDFWSSFNTTQWFSFMMSFFPLYALQIAMGMPPVRSQLKMWTAIVPNLFSRAVRRCWVFSSESRKVKWIKYIPFTILILYTFIITGFVQMVADGSDARSGTKYEYFNPLTTAWIVVLIVAIFGHLESTTNVRFTFGETIAWLFMFISLDYRWYRLHFYFGGDLDFGYDYWGVVYSLFVLLGYLLFRRVPLGGMYRKKCRESLDDDELQVIDADISEASFDAVDPTPIQYRLVLRVGDVLMIVFIIISTFFIVAPISLLIGFTKFPPSHDGNFFLVIANFFRIFVSVALPEELFFRGLLFTAAYQQINVFLPLSRDTSNRGTVYQDLEDDHRTTSSDVNGKQKLSTWRRVRNFIIAILFSSIWFGLMHWPRERYIASKFAYVALATLMGSIYCLAYIFSNYNIFVSTIVHTLTDVIWYHVFS